MTTTAATTAATSAPEQTIKSNVPEGYLVDNLSSIFDNYRGIYNIEKTSLPFLSESGASKIVRDAGFTPVIKYDYHEIIPAGYMMTFGVWPEDELYAEGKYYRKEGADIELTISQGSPPPASSQPEGYVPDIMLTDVFSSYRLDYSIDQASLPFLSETQAQSIITSHKFQPYSETLYHDIIPAGHVANIGYYAEDEMVVDDIRYRKEGAKIVLYVSMGKLPSEYISFRLTRSLVGVSYEEAIAIMDSNHITYRTESGYTDLSGRKVTAVHYHELTEIVFTRGYSALYADDRALVKDSGTLILVFD